VNRARPTRAPRHLSFRGHLRERECVFQGPPVIVFVARGKSDRCFYLRERAVRGHGVGCLSIVYPRILAAIVLAGLLLAPFGFSTPARALQSPTYLYANRSTGWGFTNNSLTSPGPSLEVEVGEHVTLNLTSVDGRNHDWFIDHNNNSIVDANESYSDSGTFRGTLEYNFTVGNQTGTFVYRSRFNGDGNLWGDITVRPAGFLSGVLSNPLLLAGIVAAVAGVVVVAIWARRRPREPPEPPSE
jgi:hypothetical protein